MAEPAAFRELLAPASWRSVEIVSDLHLQAEGTATFEAWLHYLGTSQADAIFILGDLFEVWVGDDAAAQPGFEARCAQALHAAAKHRALFFMHGNRDFLVDKAFAAQAGLTLLPDPTVLDFAHHRWLLSHGDALCLADTDYLRFRAQVRTPQWQQDFLAQSLAARQAFGRTARAQSEAHHRDAPQGWADVDAAAARGWLRHANAGTLIHGHTHRPGRHDLGEGLQRIVLSDWDASAWPARAQVLHLSAAGVKRVDLPA